MYLETLDFCWCDIFLWTEHGDGIPVFFSECVGAVFDMITGYPRRQETCVIDYYYGDSEGFSEMFEDISEIAHIGRTGYDHSNSIFFDTFC